MNQSFVTTDPIRPGHRGAEGPCFDLSLVPAVPWNCRAFDSMPKPVGVFHIYLPGLEQGFWQGFDYKNVPAVPCIYPGFAKRNKHTHLHRQDLCISFSVELLVVDLQMCKSPAVLVA